MKTTLAHYAHTNKQAERDAKERVHQLWLRAATPRMEPDDEGRDVTASSNLQMHGGMLENPAI